MESAPQLAIRSFALGCALMALAGCKKTIGSDGLLEPGELSRLESKLVAELKANQKRSCNRPVLRGTPLGGRADDDLARLVEATGPLGTCALAAHREAKALSSVLRAEKTNAPARELPYARPFLENPDAESILHADKVALACKTLPEALARAVSHRDACSPYLAGRREIDSFSGFLRLGRAAALVARRQARNEPLRAARLGFDWFRASQDLSRGGPGWIAPMVAIASLNDVAPILERILASPKLSRADLEAVGKELAILAATEPKPSLYLRGERQASELELGLTQMKGPGWSFPGMTRAQRLSTRRSSARKKPGGSRLAPAVAYTGSKRVDKALAWIAFRRTLVPLETACRRAQTPYGCVNAVASEARRSRKLAEKDRDLIPNTTKEMRKRILGILTSIAAPAHTRYLRRAARRAFLIGAMRLHVSARLMTLRVGKTPTAADIAKLPEAQREPFTGKPFQVTATPAGTQLAPTAPLSRNKPFSYLIRLP